MTMTPNTSSALTGANGNQPQKQRKAGTSLVAWLVTLAFFGGAIFLGIFMSNMSDKEDSISSGDCLALTNQQQASDGSSTFEITKTDCGAAGARYVRAVVAPGANCPNGTTPYVYTTRDPSGNPSNTQYCLDGS